MATTAFLNIGTLVTNDPSLGELSGAALQQVQHENRNEANLGIINNAAMVVEDGVVVWVGQAATAPAADSAVNLNGQAVIPGFVDSHAHLIFAGDRSEEFALRMEGKKYAAGGIRSTVTATREATDQQLRQNIAKLRAEMLASGITTFETKSGYGLTNLDETRSLRIASEHTEEVTFLGAHVFPAEYETDPDSYVELVKGSMLTAATEYAKWIDVFCDRGAFDADQATEILQAGKAAGLQPRIHANQLEAGRGIEVAVAVGAASADHCTHLTERDIELLAGSETVATLLPGAEFSTRSAYPDVRPLLAAGARVAIATDCNPGSSYTTSMPFCIAVAVRDMMFTPDQALAAATIGGAAALRRKDVGHLGLGARANFSVLAVPSHVHLAYRPGVAAIHQVWQEGRLAWHAN